MRKAIQKSVIEDLERSRKVVGELYPILEAADGEIVDGLHRKEAGWESRVTLENVTSKLQKLVVRYQAHRRRKMAFSERRALMDGIAEEVIKEGLGLPPHRYASPTVRDQPRVIPVVAGILGVNERTVQTFISDKYKTGKGGRKKVIRKHRRGSVGIRMDILKILEDPKPKTKIMYRSNLSWRPLMSHMNFLIGKKLIISWFEDGTVYYGLTELGEDILSKVKEIEPYLVEISPRRTGPRL